MIIIILLILGLALGSFINALVWRLHKQLKAKTKVAREQYSISKGRSMCVSCGHQLAPADLIPLLSWAWLRGRCRYCHKSISWQYPCVELVTALLFVVSYWLWPQDFSAAGLVSFGFWLVFLVGFMALAVYDIHWHLLPNRILMPLGVLAAIQTVLIAVFFDSGVSVVYQAVAGLLIGGGIFWIIFQVSDGKWIGGGDVKLGFLLGLIIGGAANNFLLIFIASILGTLASLPLLATKRINRSTHVPFGPFLLVAAVIVRLFGESLILWYNNQLYL